ncbi:MAG TPA: hypothetical protein VLN45_01220 [Ignavibacteriaceae bacterium]|nr:hypothetical protein [Ignavibacteriaceae bacterium]
MKDKKADEKHLIKIEDIRFFHGILTDKTVKPIENTEFYLNGSVKGIMS